MYHKKRYIFPVDNIRDLNDWIQVILERKQLSIRECMGHVSVAANILKANKKAERIFDKPTLRSSKMNVEMGRRFTISCLDNKPILGAVREYAV